MKRNAIWWVLGVLVLAPIMECAHGATLSATPTGDSVSVLYSQSQLVEGNAASVAAVHAPGAGELFLTLTDMQFADPFASLKFALTDTSSALVGLANPGTLTLTVTGPTTLYANVFATAQGSADLGLYNLTATFLSTTPVPLPPAGLLLLGGLMVPALGLLRRCRARTTVTVAMA